MAPKDRVGEPASDEELLRQHIAGRPGAFETLVRRQSGPLYRFLWRFLGDRALADDVFQETFLQIHLAEAMGPKGRFRALVRMTTAMMELRKGNQSIGEGYVDRRPDR